MSKLDIFITRTFVQVGFLVAAGAMLPGLLTQLEVPERSTWRLSSAVTAIPVLLFACTYSARRKAASGVPTPARIWIDVLVILGFGILLAMDALGMVVTTGPGPYAVALTGVLFAAGWAYLQTVNTLIRHHRTRGNGPHGDG